jgi:hypothetical protein
LYYFVKKKLDILIIAIIYIPVGIQGKMLNSYLHSEYVIDGEKRMLTDSYGRGRKNTWKDYHMCLPLQVQRIGQQRWLFNVPVTKEKLKEVL